jgi:hypothetical protein
LTCRAGERETVDEPHFGLPFCKLWEEEKHGMLLAFEVKNLGDRFSAVA